jgi:HEAT repeat protein
MMTDEHRRRIVSGLNGRNQMDAFEAAKAIWEEPDRSLEWQLILTLTCGRRPFNRTAAAYAMQVVTTPRTIRALERVVKNKSEQPRVRGHSAEALAHCHRKKSHVALLTGLDDSSKEVRFWCAFALGEMAEKRAIPALKRLVASDKRIVKGFHSVAKECADAIENIQMDKFKHRRKDGCVFCVSRMIPSV